MEEIERLIHDFILREFLPAKIRTSSRIKPG